VELSSPQKSRRQVQGLSKRAEASGSDRVDRRAVRARPTEVIRIVLGQERDEIDPVMASEVAEQVGADQTEAVCRRQVGQ
jgi:hypothetical protein